jgi:hypothetical protein
MSAQGGTITGRRPVQLPIRPIAVLLAVVTAAAIGMTAVRLADRDARVEPAVSSVEGYWNPTTGHPALRQRNGEGEASMPVQRVYPGGFVQVESEASMPVQRLYPGGFVQVEGEASMPVQRLYPGGFAGQADDGQTIVFDGRRRKW